MSDNKDSVLLNLRSIIAMIEAAEKSNGVQDNPVIREWFAARFSHRTLERAKAAISKAEKQA